MNDFKLTYLDKVIHELNNSINAIYLLSDVMLNKANLSEDNKENLSHIYYSCQKLIEIVRLLGTITNLKSDKINILMDRSDLIDLVKQEVKYYQIQTKNHALKLEFKNKISSCNSVVDNFWLRQLLGILITNAINHTENGSIEICVDIVKKDNTECFNLIVKDEGCGIPQDELESIFLPLKRGSHSVNRIPGSGIGLAIAKEVANAHGGDIVARNNTRAGAIFEVMIPIKI